MTVVKGRTSPDEQKAYQDGAYRHGYAGSVAIPRVDLWIAAFLGLRRQDSAVGGVADPSSLGMSPVFAFLCSCALLWPLLLQTPVGWERAGRFRRFIAQSL